MTKHLRSIYHGYVQIAEIDATDETAPYVAKTYWWDPSEPVATRPLALTLWTRERTARETLYYAHGLRNNLISLSSSARACTSHLVSMIPSAASLPWREMRRSTAPAVSSPSTTIQASVSSPPTTISPTVAEPPVVPSLKRSACAQIFLS
ncbi:hypothetical protein [Akkermansia glycaniphila]|uniref:hypothetical protein n=1 Tax=Akkermansia glycaniphila TaxID=1679444 RepID=UPI0012EB2785|nr:hypothetical protein [Akkermansia glycaniphila]